jgi:hypothetical protein
VRGEEVPAEELDFGEESSSEEEAKVLLAYPERV